jgi:hypothetical protein
LLLAAGRTGGSAVSRALAWRPFVFIGLISYSLYLWHWPVLIFSKASLLLPSGSTTPVALALFTASFVFAVFSWRYVERPFRDPHLVSIGTLVTSIVVASATLTVFASAAYTGMPYRYPIEARMVATYLDYSGGAGNPITRGTCFLSSGYGFDDYNLSQCLSVRSGVPNYLLIGDSHAAHFWAGLSGAFPDANVMQATASGCKPFLNGTGEPRCTRLMRHVYDVFLRQSRPDTVFLAARWEATDLQVLPATLRWFRSQGLSLVVIGPVVEYDQAFPRLLATAMRRRTPRLVDDHRVAGIAELDRELAEVASRFGVRYLSAYHALCPFGRANCHHTAANGVPVQFDYGHLTTEGSIVAVQAMLDPRDRSSGDLGGR